MGHSHSHAHGAKKQHALEAARFSTEELDMLRLSFKDLAQRSPGKTIDKETFLKFFPLPGLHGERLFHVFDNKHSGVLDYEEFVHGMAVCLRGDFTEKVRLMFDLFDIDNNQHVSRAELNTMLLQVPRQALYVLSAETRDAALRERLLEESHCHGSQAAGGAVAIDVVRQLVDDAFQTFDLNKDDKLSPAQFEMWVKSNPEVLHLLDSVFHLQGVTSHARAHVRSRSDTEGALQPPRSRSALERRPSGAPALEGLAPSALTPPLSASALSNGGADIDSHRSLPSAQTGRQSSATPLRRGFLFGRAGDRSASESPLIDDSEPSTRARTPSSMTGRSDNGTNENSNSDTEDLHGDVIMRGTLYKAGKLTRSMRARYFVLDDSVLYYYHPGKLARPAGVVFLQGCYVASRRFSSGGAGGSIRASRSTGNGGGPVAEGGSAAAGRRRRLRGSNSSHDRASAAHTSGDETTHTTSGGDDNDSGGECARALRSQFSEASIKAKRTRPADKHVYDAPLSAHLGHMFPFEVITSQGGTRDSRVLYAKTEAERAQWIEAIQRASHVVPFASKYRQLERLGHGKFAVVHKCELRASAERNAALPEAEREFFAVKIIDKALLNEKESELLRTEIAVLKLVNHENIISLEDVFESLNHIYIVQEFVQGGELFDRIVGRARLTEEEVYPLLRQLADAVHYLHVLGVAHRDIKPENILCTGAKDDPLSSATLKICDFGLSKLVSPLGVMKLACGTLSYVAPEVLAAQGYGKAADIWSIGVIVYLVRRGRLPFDGETKEEIIHRTVHGQLDFAHDAVFSRASADHVDLMRGLLCKDPRDRLTAAQVLAHPWMRRMAAESEAREAAAAAERREADARAAAMDPPPPPSPPPPPTLEAQETAPAEAAAAAVAAVAHEEGAAAAEPMRSADMYNQQ